MLALLIFPGSHPPSIVSADELNFCVRDGNRWTLIAINTNLYGWVTTHHLYVKALLSSNSKIITLTDLAVKYFLMVTHTGFEPMLTA